MVGPAMTRVALVENTRARIHHDVMVLLVRVVKVVKVAVVAIIPHDVMAPVVRVVKVAVVAIIPHDVMVLVPRVVEVAEAVVVVAAVVIIRQGAMIAPRNPSRKVSQSGARNAVKTNNTESYLVK
jgi:hypothetical protein